MARDSDIKTAPRSHAARSLTKCREFTEAAEALLGAEKWNAAGLTAVHAGICAADTALIGSAGVRSISSNHAAVITLLMARVPEFREAQKRHLAGLLRMKNAVAYEQRLLTETEARQLVDHARRLAKWAQDVVTMHAGG